MTMKDIEERIPLVQLDVHARMCQMLANEANELIGRKKEFCEVIKDTIATTQSAIESLHASSYERFKGMCIKEYEHRQGELTKMLNDLRYFDA